MNNKKKERKKEKTTDGHVKWYISLENSRVFLK
jgi:hypothetical protein